MVAELVAIVMSPTKGAQAASAPPGAGFTVTTGDLKFILKQINIAEFHSAHVGDDPTNPCAALVGPGANQIPDRLSSFGLRTVDGSCNNLFPGRGRWGSADEIFPRVTKAQFRKGEDAGPFGPPGITDYGKVNTNVVDSQPRVISNLVVDQTSENPAAVAAAGFPIRTQGNPGLFPCTTEPDPSTGLGGVPANCVPKFHTLFIPNVTTDVGLSPPYNSVFTFFGQFFDHGVDQTVKSGSAVFVPLKADDPLIAGPDHVLGNADDLPPSQRFMVLTRAQPQPGPDGKLGTADDVQEATNTDSPWVDQSQTYTSHSSHQVFLRQYMMDAGHPVDTGRLLGDPSRAGSAPDGPDGVPGTADDPDTGMATWASVKQQAHDKLGLRLVDADVTNIPMLAADPYGNFLPGPHGLPQYVTTTGLVEGRLDDPATANVDETVPVPDNVRHFDTPFLTDIAHNADPSPVDTDNNPSTPPVAPQPDGDKTIQTDFTKQPAGTYDDELLATHFAAGDGRVNENIALSAVHQIFHSEHDRLVGYIRNVLETDTTAAGQAALAAWKSTAGPSHWNYGQRLFQAARFVTEMEYQHLVFEEFARKIQPGIRPFHVYNPDLNPAIPAEFAHAVYRFGHSMLDDTVARTNESATGAKTPNDLKLLDAFLNPPSYFAATPNQDPNNPGPQYTPAQAAGAIFMGSSDQTGNELDEFVTETLRNNLLGLPLDLPTINMTRAREAGVPPLNEVRRTIFAKTGDGGLAPYTSWSDFGQHLKHQESLINFVAAYGTHPSITSKTTVKDKRAAAKLIVDPSSATDPNLVPTDAADFMFSTPGTQWASSASGVTNTGLEDVDLWVGGLAEQTNLFGGLLGNTFNYVFQTTLENLQDNDRLYYLNRTPGLNLRAQLESNSFAEMIQRNTDGTHTLKADAFATADCRFELANLFGTAAGFTQFGPSVADDPNSACDENALLLRKPDGTIQYKAINSVDKPGINGQSVYNGTPEVDRIFGGNDNDTFWGDDGNDIIEGNGGDDFVLGGDGNDRVTDLSGADFLKGGPGNDSLDGGLGDDVLAGNDGSDFMNGGANDNESFGGEGTDFIMAGAGADAVFGDGGDDWIEGGSGQDLLQGDHGAPFFDDPGETKPGNDVFVGQLGENDYDTEGGDDLMSQNAAIDRNAGAGGFDWAFHQYDTVGGDDDMMINQVLAGLPLPVVVNRDRWQETEADSGSAFDDVIKGDDNAPNTVGGAGFTGCDVLDPAGVARIKGLDALVTTFPTQLSDVEAIAATGVCPLDGLNSTATDRGTVWGEGNILLGGGGADTITGRGANDIIDGDKSLRVRISVRDHANRAVEIGSADLMESQYQRDASGALTGPTLQSAVQDGTVDPGDLVIEREIVSPSDPIADGTSVDTAVANAARGAFTFSTAADVAAANGKVTINQTGAVNRTFQKVVDGQDTLTNIEQVKFATGTPTSVRVTPAAPTGVTVTPGNGSATVKWTRSTGTTAQPLLYPLTGQQVVVKAPGVATRVLPAGASATSLPVTGLTNGTTYTFQVRSNNVAGNGTLSAGTTGLIQGPPPAPTNLVALRGNASASLTWTPPATDGGSPITKYVVQVRVAGVVQRTVDVTAPASAAIIDQLINGTTYTFRVQAVNALGAGTLSNTTSNVTPATVPDAPAITAVAGGPTTDTARTASVTWTPPAFNGGSAITGYRVTVRRVNADGTTPIVNGPTLVGASVRTRSVSLAAGNYVFDVVAVNAIGDSVATRSGLVSPS